MKSQCFSHWEDIRSGISMHHEVPEPPAENTDAASCSMCDAWEARIETTLLDDLSEEERRGLAGHMQVCPACAGRFRKYQFLEELIEQLIKEVPLHNLYEDEYEQRQLRLKKRKEGDSVRL